MLRGPLVFCHSLQHVTNDEKREVHGHVVILASSKRRRGTEIRGGLRISENVCDGFVGKLSEAWHIASWGKPQKLSRYLVTDEPGVSTDLQLRRIINPQLIFF